jgi:hypothetical protein
MKRTALSCLLLLAACDGERETSRQPQGGQKAAQAPMPELQPPEETPQDNEDRGNASITLRRYYSRIETGDYEAAWAMRSDRGDDQARRRFADNFRAYETYQADVGTPSEPVRARGWAYVEVPVMIRGTFRGGKPFSSAGSVTLRKATSGPETERGWRIYTGEGRR